VSTTAQRPTNTLPPYHHFLVIITVSDERCAHNAWRLANDGGHCVDQASIEQIEISRVYLERALWHLSGAIVS
jgi:hypothetical protein